MAYDMRNDLQETLVSKEEIDAIVARLGAEISRDYEGKNPILITVLKGAFIFMADLCRAITVPCTMDFMSVSSYGNGSTTSGTVRIRKDLDVDIKGQDVIIVEDILDSGVTLSNLIEMLQTRDPASMKLVTLFDKPDRRKADVTIDYCGMQVPDAFIVGYGLDYAEKYRNLPEVSILKPEVYTK
jgi:hypoxanthine phosphoribosyltransferase